MVGAERLSQLRLTASDGAVTVSDDITINVLPPAVIGNGTGLWGEYFNDPNNGTHFVTRVLGKIDPTVNFAWTTGAPASGVTADNFSVRWTGQVQANAKSMDAILGGLPGIQIPRVPPDRTHVYYQYCVYGPDGPKRDELVVRCVRKGIDIETLHVDVPPDMELFAGSVAESAGARRAAQAMQIPIYAGLRRDQIERVGATVRDALTQP